MPESRQVSPSEVGAEDPTGTPRQLPAAHHAWPPPSPHRTYRIVSKAQPEREDVDGARAS